MRENHWQMMIVRDVEGDTEMKELNEEEQCIMCGLTEDDEEDEVWLECTKCLKWVHKSCLPPYHPHDTDDDFLYLDCTTKSVNECLHCPFIIL